MFSTLRRHTQVKSTEKQKLSCVFIMNQAVNTNLNNNRIKGILLLLAFSTSYLHRLCNVARVEHKRKQNIMPCYGHVASLTTWSKLKTGSSDIRHAAPLQTFCFLLFCKAGLTTTTRCSFLCHYKNWTAN